MVDPRGVERLVKEVPSKKRGIHQGAVSEASHKKKRTAAEGGGQAASGEEPAEKTTSSCSRTCLQTPSSALAVFESNSSNFALLAFHTFHLLTPWAQGAVCQEKRLLSPSLFLGLDVVVDGDDAWEHRV